MAHFNIGDKVKFLNAVGGGTVTRVTDDFVFVQDDTGFDMPMPPTELIRMADMSGAGRMFNKDLPGQVPSVEEARRQDESKSKAEALNRKLREKFTGTSDDTSADQLRDENKRLRSQVANLQDQVKKLKQQLSQLQSLNARKLNDNILSQYMVRPDEAEVDLHIEALSEHPERLSDGEKHDLQLRFFHTCLNHAILNNVKKVVFIHGVGRGVLKNDIQRELEQYDGLHYMDAPMSLYGVGATEVYFGSNVSKITI